MSKYSYFELAGYTKEESNHFENLCNEYNVPYYTLLQMLNSYKKADDRQDEWKKLIQSVSK